MFCCVLGRDGFWVDLAGGVKVSSLLWDFSRGRIDVEPKSRTPVKKVVCWANAPLCHTHHSTSTTMHCTAHSTTYSTTHT